MNLTFKEICSRAKAWPRLPSISKFQYCINWRHGHQRTLSFPFILCNFKFHISNSFLIAFSPSENSQTCSRTGSQGWCTIIAQLHNNCPMHFPAIWNNIMVMIQSYLCETSKWNLHNSCYNCRRALLVNDSFISILFPFHSISIPFHFYYSSIELPDYGPDHCRHNHCHWIVLYRNSISGIIYEIGRGVESSFCLFDSDSVLDMQNSPKDL